MVVQQTVMMELMCGINMHRFYSITHTYVQLTVIDGGDVVTRCDETIVMDSSLIHGLCLQAGGGRLTEWCTSCGESCHKTQ